MTALIDKPEVGRTDAALLVEELTGIYTTPTPKGWREAKNVIVIDWFDVLFYNSRGLIFIPGTEAWILLKYDSLQSLK